MVLIGYYFLVNIIATVASTNMVMEFLSITTIPNGLKVNRQPRQKAIFLDRQPSKAIPQLRPSFRLGGKIEGNQSWCLTNRNFLTAAIYDEILKQL